MDVEQVQARLQMSADEDFVLTAWQYRMLQRDIAAAKGKHLPSKRAVRDEFRNATVEVLGQRGPEQYGAEIAHEVRRLDPMSTAPNFEVLEEAGPAVTSTIARRSRALLVMIDLYGFEPWGETRWDKDARTATLSEAHQAMAPLRPEDLHAVAAAYTDAFKKLAGPGSWKKYALLAGAGVALGALAVPAVAGAAALGGKLRGFTAPRVAADAIRLHVVTQLVLRDIEGDEEAAKAVIVSMRERVANLTVAFATLTERYDALRAQLAAKQQEVEDERARRLEAESKLAWFESLSEKVKERISGPDEAELETLSNQLSLLADERKATRAVADGVASLADDLEAVA
ncbi:hypothetical protein FK529_03070 [Tsukamurella asaccharolytica]|uniref:Uncharacterized protein n=1 Tax=Tsukamurella asaccharolytica TaxID=2592067 RepID=A0A5C5RHA5_9ACTN|nr:hypothetical protein [Tsukamurella asaccharolytica]TWS21581.1 hypothetical protein FK529_03070 [Tsukamurella asaccharolytica]